MVSGWLKGCHVGYLMGLIGHLDNRNEGIEESLVLPESYRTRWKSMTSMGEMKEKKNRR